MNIVLCGFMGSGKTVVGKELAKIMGRRFVDTDELVEKERGVTIKAIFATRGEDYFRDLEHNACIEASEMADSVISTGGGALTFSRNVDVFSGNSVIVFLDASFDVICQRVGKGESRPLFKDKEKAKALYDSRKTQYEKAADVIVDGNMSARKTAMYIASLYK